MLAKISKRFAILLILVLAAGLLGGGLPPAAALARQLPPPPAGRPPYEGLPDALRLPSAGATVVPRAVPLGPGVAAEAGAPAAPQIADWTRLVFQSYRNGHDWEISGARGDGAEQANLSNHGSMDIQPRLNRGATRVVFASNRDGNYEIYAMNADGSGQWRLTDNGASDTYPAWSPDGGRIVFQSYRDGQAELYVMNADGSGQARLTYHDEYDGEAAWSPDGMQIAFTRRSGDDYRIWVMNADGSGARQLSDQRNSENPAWSPDGRVIAYDATADGERWQEIWLMDASGSNQRQVYDPPDGSTDAWVRSWSPDGRYVAFTRISFTEQGGSWYWTYAYLDALEAQNPSNVIRLSDSGDDWNPDWQPTDVWAPVSEMQPMPAHSPSQFFVGWSGTDVGPAGVDTYDLQVKDGAAAAWTDWLMGTYNTPVYYPGVSGHTYYFRVRARDNAGNLERWPDNYEVFTTVESLPPVTAVQPLPAFTRGSIVEVTWGGTDPGDSGIQAYDVQTRRGAGPWTDWRTETVDTSATFLGSIGVQYGFRVRARDWAQNQEAWPPGDGDAQTTFYRWGISGAVQDNSGTPLVGAAIITSPAPLGSSASTDDGSYAAYVGEAAESYGVSASKTGYGSPPETAFPGEEDAQLRLVLPPADDVVLNGGFEEALAGTWDAGGAVVPAPSASARHTGQRGAMLGWPDWPFTSPVLLSNAAGNSTLADAIGDDDGVLHVLWQEWDMSGSNLGIRYARRAAGGTWSAPESLSAGQISSGGRFALDQNGIVHAAWADYNDPQWDIFYQQRAPNGQWSAPENVSRSPTSNSYQPWIGVDGNGTAHVIWGEGGGEGNQIYHARRSIGGDWTTPVKVSNAGAYGAHFGSAAVTASGEVAVVWTEQIGGGATMFWAHRNLDGTWAPPEQLFTGDGPRLVAGPEDVLHLLWTHGDEIRYANRPASKPWSSAETVIVPRPGYSAGANDMVVDGKGVVHVAVSSWDDIKYVYRDGSNTWSLAELIAATPNGSGNLDLGVDSKGTLYAVWRNGWEPAYNYWRETLFARRDAAGKWSTARKISGASVMAYDSAPLQVVVDGQDRAHVVWNSPNDYVSDVFHILFVGMPAGEAWLRQQLTVPTSAANPGLSFLYQLHQEYPEGENPFSVVIQDGGGATTVFSTPEVTTAWEHRWIDLAPWRGEDVTITFKVQNAADTSPALVDLEEVTVGSAHPDIWVSQSGPSRAAPGQQFLQTISYGNRGGVAAGDGRVTLQLPPGLLFIGADPPPSATTPVLRWDVGGLAAQGAPEPILVTLQVAPSAEAGTTLTAAAGITSSTPELEQANNTAEAPIRIDHPDIWVSQSGPSRAAPGQQFVQAITYGNQGGAPATGGRVTLQLPPGLALISAAPPPSAASPDLRWDVGDLAVQDDAHTILVTLQVAPSVVPGTVLTVAAGITSDTAELEQANNTAEADLDIRTLLYLPLIRR